MSLVSGFTMCWTLALNFRIRLSELVAHREFDTHLLVRFLHSMK
jgi:hypothetical protein